MKCIYCSTELPCDSNTKHIKCPKCGSEFDVETCREYNEKMTRFLLLDGEAVASEEL